MPRRPSAHPRLGRTRPRLGCRRAREHRDIEAADALRPVHRQMVNSLHAPRAL
jgi:hypothetical protein